MRLKWSIFAQLLTLTALLVVGGLALGAWAAAAAAERTARSQAERQVNEILQTLEDANFPLTETVVDLLKKLSGFEFVVVEATGHSFSTFTDGGRPLPVILEEGKSSLGARRPTPRLLLGERRMIGQRHYLASAAAAPLGKANAGSAVAVWLDEEHLAQASAGARSFLWMLFGGGAAAAVLIAVLISTWFARRLRRLKFQAQRIADGDFRESPVVGPEDELASLARALNETATRLAAATESLRRSERLQLLGRLGGGLAHQLRNHVAGARLALEVGVDEESISVALRQLTLAEQDLQRFLEVGRDQTGDRKELEPSRLVDETLELLRPRAQHLGIELSWTRPRAQHLGIELSWTPPRDEPLIVADAAQLRHIIANLTMNAMEAAGPGGGVTVEQRSDADHLEWRVSDTGPGPPAELAATLFEPFVSGKPHGIGLGLAVVKHATEQHGGAVDYQRANGRTVFVVRLPWRTLPSDVTASSPHR